MNPYIIIYLGFVHWVADFFCQNDYMALNKSKSNKALSLHSFVYFLVLSVMTCNTVFGLVNALIHFPVDWVTSRINSKLWAAKKNHWFFVSVGFDQWIHFATLIITYKYLGNYGF